MPPAPTPTPSSLPPRREAFARAYAACGNAAEAARRAGYAEESAKQTGHRLLGETAVSDRIAALRAEVERARETDRDLLMAKFERLFDASMEAGSFAAAARAATMQARLAGLDGPARSREAEPVTPGRPGPVARAAARAEPRRLDERVKAARRGEAEDRAADPMADFPWDRMRRELAAMRAKTAARDRQLAALCGYGPASASPHQAAGASPAALLAGRAGHGMRTNADR